jgi:hypothetical protein
MSFFLPSSNHRQPRWELHSIERFSDYLTVWNELNAQGPESPLLSTDFVFPVMNHFGRPDNLLAICKLGTNPIAMALLAPVGIGRWSTLNPIVDPLQPPVAPLGLLVARKDTQITELLPRLLKALPGFPLVLSVMNQDDRLVPRPNNAGSFNTIDHITTPSIHINTSYSIYWKSRKAHFKQNLRRRRKLLLTSGRIPLLEILSSTDSSNIAFDDFCKIEHSGWKGKEGVSLEHNRLIKQCYQDIINNFFRNGNALIYKYFYDNRIAAMDICLKNYNTLFVFKTTYDEAESVTGPAFLMREEQLRSMFDQGKVGPRIEFYGPLMDWQRRWATEVRTMYHLNCYRFNFIREINEKIKAIQRLKLRLKPNQTQRSGTEND